MINHVLIPLDGSLVTEHALEPVKDILRPGGKTTLLAVGDADRKVQMGGREDAVVPLDMYLEQIANRIRLDGFEAEIEIRSGDSAATIVELATTLGVDMIVMSSDKPSGLERLLAGGLTQEVINGAPCPVLVVPPRVRERVSEPAVQPDEAAPDLNVGLA